ncbi:MAG: beta-galactosidase [Oscillospiraceae bacterium]|nr:beta-galactosidase [Oscillospiraceae bacterium]
MKRFFALILCAVLVFGCSVPAAVAAAAALTDFNQAYFDGLAAKEQELKDKLDACALADIAVDYELVNYNAFKRFSEGLCINIERGSFNLEEALYYDRCLNDLYNEAAASLDAFLSGEKTSAYVPRYVTGPLAIDGQSILGKTKAGDAIEEGRPIFFTGFAGWGDAGANTPDYPGLGLNIVAQEIGPNSFIAPPAQGSEDEFSIDLAAVQRIKDVLAAAEEHNVFVDMLLSPHYFPDFLLNKYPELRMDNGPAGFIKYDVADPLAREVTAAFLQALCNEIRDYESLHSLCLANEPVFHSWMRDTHLAPWREFLRDRYGDIGDLNGSFRTKYRDFDEIPFPDMDKPSPLAVDFVDYNDKVMNDFSLLQIESIREIMPDIPIHTKLMDYYSTGKWRTAFEEQPFMRGVDHEKISEFTQINGCDAWRVLQREWQDQFDQAFDPVRYSSKNMWYDLLRSNKNAPIFNSEDHFTIDDDERLLPEFRPFFISDLWMGAVHGRTLSAAWVWESGGPGSALYHSVGWRPDFVAAMGRTNLDLNRLAYEVTALQNAEAEVAVMHSKSSRVFDYTNVAETTYDAYQYATLSGQRVDFVTENDIAEKLDNYRMLILPKTSRLPQDAVEAVRAFQKNGGSVVIIGLDSLWFDEYNRFRSLSDIFSIYLNADKVLPSFNIFGFSLAFLKRAQQKTVQKVIAEKGLYNVALTDAKTKRPVLETEWFETEYEGKTLISICNYNWKNEPAVKISVDGRECAAIVDLITGETFTGSVTLKPYLPRLLQVQ